MNSARTKPVPTSVASKIGAPLPTAPAKIFMRPSKLMGATYLAPPGSFGATTTVPALKFKSAVSDTFGYSMPFTVARNRRHRIRRNDEAVEVRAQVDGRAGRASATAKRPEDRIVHAEWMESAEADPESVASEVDE